MAACSLAIFAHFFIYIFRWNSFWLSWVYFTFYCQIIANWLSCVCCLTGLLCWSLNPFHRVKKCQRSKCFRFNPSAAKWLWLIWFLAIPKSSPFGQITEQWPRLCPQSNFMTHKSIIDWAWAKHSHYDSRESSSSSSSSPSSLLVTMISHICL